jgi:hypothetical protein
VILSSNIDSTTYVLPCVTCFCAIDSQRWSSRNKIVLFISELRSNYCYGINKYGESHSIDTFLKIPEKPIVTVKKNLYCVKAGDCLTIECDIFSECGLKSVWWQKFVGSTITIIRSKLADKKYNFIPARPSLTIYSTEASDAGQYICCAETKNRFGYKDVYKTQNMNTLNV